MRLLYGGARFPGTPRGLSEPGEGRCRHRKEQRRRLEGRHPTALYLYRNLVLRGLRWEAHARSARLLYGGARFPRVACVPSGPGEGRCRQRRAAAAPWGPPPAELRKPRPETKFALGGPCALGEASVRRCALPQPGSRVLGWRVKTLRPTLQRDSRL